MEDGDGVRSLTKRFWRRLRGRERVMPASVAMVGGENVSESLLRGVDDLVVARLGARVEIKVRLSVVRSVHF